MIVDQRDHEMDQKNRLRPKGPLNPPKTSSQQSAAYSTKSTLSNDLALEISKSKKKRKEQTAGECL